MSLPLKTTLIRAGLLCLGLAAWAGAGRSLHERGAFQFVPNAFSLKGSPFGRTLGMAMQGPVDVYFHQGGGHEGGAHQHAPGEACDGCETVAEDDAPHSDPVEDASSVLVTTGGAPSDDAQQHGEACGSSCGHDHGSESPAVASGDAPWRAAILGKIRDWRGVKNSRTNPHGNSEAHKYYIRAKVEQKLLLTYQMDPTNYGSYGAYHLFLNEPSLGTRGEASRRHGRRLAEVTVARCVREWDNPIALLTTAAASHDMVEYLVEDSSPEKVRRAHEYAALTAKALEQFENVSLQMLFDGTWDEFSTARQDEMTSRARQLRKMHEADLVIIRRYVSQPTEPEGHPAG